METHHRPRSIAGLVFIFITLFSWSSVLLFLRYLSPHIDGWTANGWRYALSASLLFPFLIRRQLLGLESWGVWRRALVPSFFNAIGQTFFAFSIYYIEPGLAGFLQRISLVTSTTGAFILFADERILLRSRLFWIGIFTIVAGSILTISLGNQPLHGDSLVGISLALCCGLFFGTYGVSVRYYMRGLRPTDSFAAIATTTAIVMMILMVIQSPTHGTSVFHLSGYHVILLALSSIIGIAVGHIFYYAAIARLGVAVASAVVQLSPFLCATGSVLIFGEQLSAGQWIAGVGMLCGAGLLIRAEQSRDSLLRPGELPPVGLKQIEEASSLNVLEEPAAMPLTTAAVTGEEDVIP